VLQVNRFRNQHHIHVYGTDIAEPVATFGELQAEYCVDARIMSNIESMGFHTPTVIEMQAIPVMLHVRPDYFFRLILSIIDHKFYTVVFCLTGLCFSFSTLEKVLPITPSEIFYF